MKKKILQPILIGILISAFLFPAPTYAQWTVFDPTANVNAIKQLQQWIQAIQKYETMITQGVESITNLQGILKQAETSFKWTKDISDWGKLIRMGFKLKWQVENFISMQGRAFMSIQRRAMSGIFNPDQDLRDFENYLKYSVGRTAEDEVYKINEAIKNDPQIKMHEDQIRELSEQTAHYQEEIENNEKQIEELQNCNDCSDKDQKILQLKLLNDQLTTKQQAAMKEYREIKEKAAIRAEAIAKAHDKHRFFGKQIKDATDGWEQLTKETEDLMDTFSKERKAPK
jgi:hypothetical protein